jgi:hypothetical protein
MTLGTNDQSHLPNSWRRFRLYLFPIYYCYKSNSYAVTVLGLDSLLQLYWNTPAFALPYRDLRVVLAEVDAWPSPHLFVRWQHFAFPAFPSSFPSVKLASCIAYTCHLPYYICNLWQKRNWIRRLVIKRMRSSTENHRAQVFQLADFSDQLHQLLLYTPNNNSRPVPHACLVHDTFFSFLQTLIFGFFWLVILLKAPLVTR